MNRLLLIVTEYNIAKAGILVKENSLFSKFTELLLQNNMEQYCLNKINAKCSINLMLLL